MGQGLGFSGATADDAFLYTIWDGGGNDTIDASGFDVRAEIDLREGRFSSIGKDSTGTKWDDDALPNNPDDPDPGNVAIAYGTKIENAIGTDFDDSFIGNASNNLLQGGLGSDTYHYALSGGNDTIEDTGGANDGIVFAPSITPGQLDLSQSGNDLVIDITGGGQVTVTDHFLSASEIENIEFSLDDGNGGTISGGEVFTGTALDDNLFGSSGNDFMAGFSGNDTLSGGVRHLKRNAANDNGEHLSVRCACRGEAQRRRIAA